MLKVINTVLKETWNALLYVELILHFILHWQHWQSSVIIYILYSIFFPTLLITMFFTFAL